MSEALFGRRTLLRSAGGAAVAAVAASALAACGADSDEPTGAAGNEPAPDGATTGGPVSTAPTGGGASTGASSSGGTETDVVPAFVASDVVEPDLPGNEHGVPDAFLAYPASPVRAYTEPPLSGGSVSVLKLTTKSVPPPVGKNPFWQELNKRVGTELKVTNIISSDYEAKVATVIAGGDLPDLMQMRSSFVPNLAELLDHKFQDLTEWLAGDAVKAYPSLAALPTAAWRNVVFDGKIYGIPFPLGVVGSDNKIRQDVVDKLGLSTDLADGQEFVDLCHALTDEKSRRWALGSIWYALSMVSESVGVPNSWRVDDGVFTKDIDTEEYQQALDICRQLWADGCVHPDSLASAANFQQRFTSGQALILRDGYTNWSSLTALGLTATPDFAIGGVVMPKWDGGGQAPHFQGSGMYTFTAMKKQSPDRAQDLLKVLDWFASPFGSDEYMFKQYGIADRDYTLTGTDPVPTETGMAEVKSFSAAYIATAPQPIYIPGHPDVAKADHAYLSELMKAGVPLPTVGLISPTELSKGASLNADLNSAVTDIIVGRKKLSTWDGVVKAWKSAGGADITKEYTDAYAAANGA